MSCRLVRRHIGVMVDGELDPATQIEFERHLSECAPCQERLAFEEAMRGQVRDAVGRPAAPEALRTRVLAGLDAVDREMADGTGGAARGAPLVRMWPMKARHAVPLALAAAAALLLVGGPLTVGDGRSGAVQRAGMAGGGGPALEDVVRLHSHRLPADVPGEQPKQVVRYFHNKVEFPVRTAEFGRRDVRLTGARLANVRDRGAAAMFYDVHGRRMTMVVFKPPARAFPPARGALEARLGGRRLYYQHVRGHVVPVRRHRGLTYALTGDLPRKQLLELAAALQVRP